MQGKRLLLGVTKSEISLLPKILVNTAAIVPLMSWLNRTVIALSKASSDDDLIESSTLLTIILKPIISVSCSKDIFLFWIFHILIDFLFSYHYQITFTVNLLILFHFQTINQ